MSFEQWYKEYLKDHRPQSPHALAHSIGFVIFAVWCISSLFSADLMSIGLGFVYGFLITHTVPALMQHYNGERVERGYFGGHCHHCFYSMDTL